jgi:hypothetical protein
VPGLVVGLIISYLSIAGVIDMGAARTVLVLTGIIAIVGLITTDWFTQKPRKEKLTSLVFLTATVAVLGFALDRWTTGRIALAKEVEEGNRTGGDSFAYATFAFFENHDSTSLVGLPTFIHRGRYPLKGVFARVITDPTTGIDANRIKVGDIKIRDRLFFDRTPIEITRGNVDSATTVIRYGASNEEWVQTLDFAFVDSSWEVATRVSRGERVLLECASSRFPRTRLDSSWKGDVGCSDDSGIATIPSQ